MGIHLVGWTMGRPAGVAHPCPRSAQVPVALGQGLGEPLEVPRALDRLYAPILFLMITTIIMEQEGQPGRVVAAVLKAFEALYQNLHAALLPFLSLLVDGVANVTHYAAHNWHTSLCAF